VRAIFFDEDDARAVAARLVADGFSAEVGRDRFAGEDDDEDHPWFVRTDAPDFVLELVVDETDGWLDDEAPTPPATPLDLPATPRRVKRPAGRRLLAVHAHPDDETLTQGGTLARCAAEGVGVTVVTCTAGELGEVFQPELQHLTHERGGGLGAHRRTEIAAAMKALGVTDHRWLGGFGRYHDSGMQWHADGHAVAADETPAHAFCHADLAEAATLLAGIIREVRPQVVTTYDDFGGYGHPDHLMTHRVTMYAVQLSAVPTWRRDLGEPWEVDRVLWCTLEESATRAGLRALAEAGTGFTLTDPGGELPRVVVPDEDVDVLIDVSSYVGAKVAALRAHATQVRVEGDFYALTNLVGLPLQPVEAYRLAAGAPYPPGSDDLFAGPTRNRPDSPPSPTLAP